MSAALGNPSKLDSPRLHDISGRDTLINAYAPPGRCPGLSATFGLTARPNHLPIRRKQAYEIRPVVTVVGITIATFANAMLSYVVSVVVNNNPRARQAFSKRPFLLAIS